MDEPELAGASFQNALGMARRTNNYGFVAYTLNDLGMLLLKQNQIAAAESSHQNALKILKDHEPQDTEGIAETEAYLANCQAASGRYDLAIKNYQYALSLQQDSQDMIGQAETQLSLGLAESASHRMERALQSLKTAAELYRRTHERHGESSARFEIARIYAALGDNASAKSEVMAAIKLAEEIRGFIPGPSLRTASFASLEKMYRFEIDLLLKNQSSVSENQFLAFDMLQRAQSRTLLEALQHGGPADYLPHGGEVAVRQTEILEQLKEANQKLAWQLRKNSAADAVDQTFIKVKLLETSLDEIDAEAQVRQPRMAIISPTPMSVVAIQQELLEEKTALVQFYLSNPLSYAWIITKVGTQLIPLPAKDLIEQQVRNVVSFGDDGLWTKAQSRGLASLDRIMRPVFAASQSTRWIVVPDGALHSFPFALLSMMGKAERKIIKIPSASSVRALRSADSRARAAYKLAVFADPVFDADDSRVRPSSAHAQNSLASPTALHHQKRQNNNGSYARLPYTRLEATLISAFVPRGRVMSFLDFAAGLDTLADNRLSDFNIIHFATHSLVDYRHPELSRIVLSLVTKEGRPAQDIYC
jgi:tetratricopeptide (TPR) repeat protein